MHRHLPAVDYRTRGLAALTPAEHVVASC
jgi:hypothetical protein